ncbi:MAG: hypothetical protein VCB43_09950, partial [Myxococcota bacterium]
MSDVLSIARSGLQASSVRLRNSAHNVANIAMPIFKNHRTENFSLSGGGSAASTRIDDKASDVNHHRHV